MFAALSALDNSGDKTSGRPVTVAATMTSSDNAGASSKKKKKKKGGGGGGGGNANDAMLAERMQRLMAPLPSREPAPEQWSKVEKGAGIAKSAAKNTARGVGASTTSKPTAVDPSCAVLRKFSQTEDNGSDGGAAFMQG